MSPWKEKTMARSTLVSPSEADKQYAKANNLVRPAIFFPVTAVIFLLLSGYIPGGIALFFSVYCLLLGIASAFLAVTHMLRRYDRWIVHVEGMGISIRPTLALVRVKQIAFGIGIACAPIAIIIEVLVTHSAVGAVLSLITGLMFSTMFYFMFMSSPHRLWLIHQGPIIEFTPEDVAFRSLIDKSATRIPWDRHPTIKGFSPIPDIGDQLPLMYVSADGANRDMEFDMTGIPIPLSRVDSLVTYFNNRPEKLAMLASSEGARMACAILTDR